MLNAIAVQFLNRSLKCSYPINIRKHFQYNKSILEINDQIYSIEFSKSSKNLEDLLYTGWDQFIKNVNHVGYNPDIIPYFKNFNSYKFCNYFSIIDGNEKLKIIAHFENRYKNINNRSLVSEINFLQDINERFVNKFKRTSNSGITAHFYVMFNNVLEESISILNQYIPR